MIPFLVLLGLLLAQSCYAFGHLGHYIIGEVTFKTLSYPTLINMDNCDFLDPFNNSMGIASVWADTIKRNPKYRWTSPFHYYDIDNNPPSYCGRFSPPSSNRTINLYNGIRRALKDTTQCSKKDKNSQGSCCASKFNNGMLVHLLQDLYQPLHLVGKSRGGNDEWFIVDGKRYNLHKFWDSDGLNMMLKDSISTDYTTEDAINYFYRKLDDQFLPNPNCPSWQNNEQNNNMYTVILDYIFKDSQSILNSNCDLIWNTNDENYIIKAKELIEKLMLSSIKMSNCVFSYLYGRDLSTN